MKLGFIVNPIAGMGGKVALKGTDNVLEKAIAKGAEPIAPKRATEFLVELKKRIENSKIHIISCPGIMGEEEAVSADVVVHTLVMDIGETTTAEDTKNAIRLFILEETDLIVFVGGDGTARDIHDVVNEENKTLALGVPSGVKMYSGIFAVNPSDAADIVAAFTRKETQISEFEIMDADEQAIRQDRFEVKLHGYLRGPFLPALMHGSKQVSPETVDEKDNQMAIAKFVVEEMQPDAWWILGPGTTVKCIAERIGMKKTALGVDIYRKGKLAMDVDEKKILQTIDDWKNAWIVLSPIGRQGILLGRGNQQISPEVIKRVGRDRILVVATKNKLDGIEGKVLRVDTGDSETDEMLRGYGRVITDYREWRLVEIQ